MNLILKSRTISYKKKAAFFSEWGLLLESGMPITDGLEVVLSSGSYQSMGSFEQILQEIREGNPICGSFQKGVLNQHDKLYLSIGESSGTLTECLQALSGYYGKKDKRKKQWIEALSYPVLLVVLSVLVTSFLLAVVVPLFSDMYTQAGKELPAITRLVISISHFFVQHFGLIILCAGVLAVAGYFVLSRADWRQRVVDLLFGLPGLGGYLRLKEQSQFFYLLSFLLSHGQELLFALKNSVGSGSSGHLQRACISVDREVRDGKSLSQSFMEQSYFRTRDVRIIALGEESGRLSELLLRLHREKEVSLERAGKIIQKASEPVLLIGVGGLVAFVLIAMYMPMFQMGHSVF